MTLPQLIFVLVALWLFIAIGGLIAACKERKRNLKAINDAHKVEQTILDPHELKDFECHEPFFDKSFLKSKSFYN